MPGALQQVSYGSGPVNGQLIGVRTASGYNPINYGVGRASVPVASPVTMPPSVASLATMQPGATGGGGGLMVTSSQSRGNYTGSMLGSPAFAAAVALVAGLLMLRYIHFRP